MPLKTETLPNGTAVYTDEAHRIGTDSLLLARFCGAKPHFSVCDLGCGGGILLLSLLDAGCHGHLVGVDKDSDAIRLLQQAKTHNRAENMEAVCASFTGYRTTHRFDMAIANPPYFTEGARAASTQRAAARHWEGEGLAGLCEAAARLLKDGGRFCLCYPAGQISPLFAALTAAHLVPKRLRLVRHAPQKAAWLALVDARKRAGEGLIIEPDILMETPVCY